MDNIVFVNFECNETIKSVPKKIWQYGYGQILRIQGLNLPSAVEIHFSLQKSGGVAERRIGVTRDGVTDVVIPDFILKGGGIERDYYAYAFIYLSSEEYGQTEHRIELNIISRPEPEGSTGSDETSFGAIMDAVNKIAEQNGQGVSDEKIAEAVNAYMEANPVEGNVTVDTDLSETSTNPVQNKVVAAKFSQLQDTVNNKLDSSKLPEAIDTALTQAKESGEFKGEKGDKGDKGDDGKTPEKGIDYFTETDKNELVTDVLEALPTWTGGSY